MIDYIILGSLTIRNMSGYEIRKLMSYSTAFFSNVSFGSIYPALNKLEKNGLVVVKEVVDTGRYKKIYEITEEGRSLFQDMMAEPLRPFNFRYEILIRIFFAQNLSNQQLLTLINEHLTQLSDLASDLKEIGQSHMKGANNYQKYALQFGHDFYDFLIKWYQDLIIELEEEPLEQ
ncbi:MAG: PadR family transcriptional regulator [Syntrophomonadaceae bacterium]|nr:PadR family transcriptional regulator [Syntrophomonadaceae bacterium]